MIWTLTMLAAVQREADAALGWIAGRDATGSIGTQRARDLAYFARCQNALRYLHERIAR